MSSSSLMKMWGRLGLWSVYAVSIAERTASVRGETRRHAIKRGNQNPPLHLNMNFEWTRNDQQISGYASFFNTVWWRLTVCILPEVYWDPSQRTWLWSSGCAETLLMGRKAWTVRTFQIPPRKKKKELVKIQTFIHPSKLIGTNPCIVSDTDSSSYSSMAKSHGRKKKKKKKEKKKSELKHSSWCAGGALDHSPSLSLSGFFGIVLRVTLLLRLIEKRESQKKKGIKQQSWRRV